MTTPTAEMQDSNWREDAVRKIARSPDASRELARKRVSRARAKNPGASEMEVKVKAAKVIVRDYAALSGAAGSVTGMIGAVPVVGTAVAITVGATGDLVLYTKANIDMCSALVYVFHPTMSEGEAFSRAMTLARLDALKNANDLGHQGATLASGAGVRILRRHLPDRMLIAVKPVFKPAGITVTRKAVERAIPFGVGAVIGASVNAGMTAHLGRQARKQLELDAHTS